MIPREQMRWAQAAGGLRAHLCESGLAARLAQHVEEVRDRRLQVSAIAEVHLIPRRSVCGNDNQRASATVRPHESGLAPATSTPETGAAGLTGFVLEAVDERQDGLVVRQKRCADPVHRVHKFAHRVERQDDGARIPRVQRRCTTKAPA